MARKIKIEATSERRREFFAWSDRLDHDVLRPLSHISMGWEMMWDHQAKRYEPEEGTLANEVNDLIDCIALSPRPPSYHDNEDVIANYMATRAGWNVRKEGNKWVGAEYSLILEQGGFDDIDQEDLKLAATGRVCAAIEHGQFHYDDMEDGHRTMLANILSIILYHGSKL